MKKIIGPLSVFGALMLVVFFVVLGKSSPSQAVASQNFSQEEILVQFRPLVPQGLIDQIARGAGAQIKEKLLLPRTFVLRVPQGQEEKLVQALSRNPLVSYAELNYEVQALEVPNDPYFSSQWGMTKVQAPEAWDITHGSPSVRIAIVDTGIDRDHEDLLAKVISRVNLTDAPTDDDLFGHGSYVAGIASAQTNNALGVAGLGYDTSLMSVKVLNDSGSGFYSWVANGIVWAADNGAQVINLSLGGSGSSTTLQNAVNYAWSRGVVLACAAGNSNSSSPIYPAYYTNCLATAATDQNDQRGSFSNYGTWVDVAAPGVNIFSIYPNQPSREWGTNINYGSGSGTSAAAPHVAGLAGLIWGSGLCTTNTCVRSQIENNADQITGTGTYWFYGRINAFRAVSGTVPTVTPTPTSIPTPTPTPTPTITPTPTPTPPSDTDAPISLSPSMVTNESGRGNAGNLVDESNAAGYPPTSNPSTNWFPGWSSAYYPASAYIDLGQNYLLSEIWLRDENGIGNVTISSGTPGNWTSLFIDPMTSYLRWNKRTVSTTTRYLRVTLGSTGAAQSLYDLVLYGRPGQGLTPTPTPTPTATPTPTPTPIPDTIPPVIGSVNATPTATSAQITWTTDEAADSQVEYGTTSGLGLQTPLDQTLTTNHLVTLSSLSPDTLYYYKVKSKDSSGNLAEGSLLNFTTQSQSVVDAPILLYPSMVTNESGRGNAGNLVDESNVAGYPPTSNPSTNWMPGWSTSYYPASAYIDLGQNYILSEIWLRDENGIGNVTISSGTPGNWTSLFVDGMGGYLVWRKTPVSVTTRYIRVTLATTGAGQSLYDLVLYGRPQ